MHLIFIFLIVMLKIKNAVAPEQTDLWVAWNIGQGQWVTHVLPDECRHYDIGGEPGTFGRVKPLLLKWCGKRMNRLYLSHWDADHFQNVPGLARSLPGVCWQVRPQVFEEKKAAQKILQLGLRACDELSDAEPMIWKSSDLSKTNESSNIAADNGVLNTGDSPLSVEKRWVTEMPGLEDTQVLILGHHGSRTSTGLPLLERLPRLKWTIASARFAKYRHPHTETLVRVARRSVPVLRTEVWGNIWFQVRNTKRF